MKVSTRKRNDNNLTKTHTFLRKPMWDNSPKLMEYVLHTLHIPL